MAWALSWLACVAPGPYGQPGSPPFIPTPAVADLSLDCDPDRGQWALLAAATSWTGGGRSFWTRDLQYIEQHTVLAVASPPEPTGDELELELSIVSDWREQTPGVSTVFTCGDEPSVAFTLLDVDNRVVDCRVSGALASELEAMVQEQAPEVGCALWKPATP